MYVPVTKQNTEYQYWKHTEVTLPVWLFKIYLSYQIGSIYFGVLWIQRSDTSGPPRQGRQERISPCLDFWFQYTLKTNKLSKIFGVEYWTLPGSNSQIQICKKYTFKLLVMQKDDVNYFRIYI